MSRTAVPFRQADVTRALRGALAAGIEIARVEIDGRGKIVIGPGRPGAAPLDGDAAELDRELAEFEARNDKG